MMNNFPTYKLGARAQPQVKLQPFCSSASPILARSLRKRTRRWQFRLELPWNTHSPPADVFLSHGKNRWKAGSEEVVRAKILQKHEKKFSQKKWTKKNDDTSQPCFLQLVMMCFFHLPSDKPTLFTKKNWQRLIPRVVKGDIYNRQTPKIPTCFWMDDYTWIPEKFDMYETLQMMG